MERFTIGQMAQVNHVTKKTLMLYHKKGLLIPEDVDPQTGYRYYSLTQCSTLDMIQRMKQVGLSLDEIKNIIDKKDVAYLQRLLMRQIDHINQSIRDLELSKSIANDLENTCSLFQHKPPCGVPRLEWTDKRRILIFPIEPYYMGTHRTPENPSLSSWEKSLRSIKQDMLEQGFPLALFHDVGCVISRESLLARKPLATGGFVFNPQGLGDREEYWPEGWCLTMDTDTMFSPDGRYLERDYLEQLLDIAEQEHYTICGDYYCEILAETPAFLYEGRDMMIRLRVPVSVDSPKTSPYYQSH